MRGTSTIKKDARAATARARVIFDGSDTLSLSPLSDALSLSPLTSSFLDQQHPPPPPPHPWCPPLCAALLAASARSAMASLSYPSLYSCASSGPP